MIDRRTLLKGVAAGGAAATVVGSGASGCGNDVEPAPIANVMVDDNPGSNTYGKITVPVAMYPQLAAVGGAITLQLQKLDPNPVRMWKPPANGTVLLIHYDAQTFAALDATCPHKSCPLGYSAEDKLVECPCHGSRFLAIGTPGDLNFCPGKVVHLPAASPIAAWDASFDATNNVVTVDLNVRKGCDAGQLPPVVNGTVTIPLAAYPQLAMVGGSITGQPMGLKDNLIVVRVDTTTVAVLSSICTHLGCTVAYATANKDLECPCHGSKYDLMGNVLNGPNPPTPPVPTALKKYPVTFDGKVIVITAG
jgi:Rieske Fe-S protein